MSATWTRCANRPLSVLVEHCFSLLAWSMMTCVLSACGSGTEPLRIAVLMGIAAPSTMGATSPPPGMNMSMGSAGATPIAHPNMDWAAELVNAAGGVAGRPLELEYFDFTGKELSAIIEISKGVASNDRYVAAIAPPGSEMLAAVADSYLAANKPLVSTTSAAAEILRAYGGKGVIWRTRQSDIAQTELLVRIAKQEGLKRLALISTLDNGGYTFFSWFGFFAKELGYPDDAISISAFAKGEACDLAVQSAVSSAPDIVFIAAGASQEQDCILHKLAQNPGPRVMLADTGLDTNRLSKLGPATMRIEGLSGAGTEQFEQAFHSRFGGALLAPHGPNEYDAILLLSYGLAASGGQGGQVLVDALKAVVDGREDGVSGWDQAGIASALSLLAQGHRPRIPGATGPLRFEPGLYVDLSSSTLTHWRMTPQGPQTDRRYFTGDPAFLSSSGVFVPPNRAFQSDLGGSAWTPKVDKADSWAVIAALSSGWSNYRHQADALRQYQLLRAQGFEDDHIVLIMADDLATSIRNPLAGTVRNEPGGPNLYRGVVRDYNLLVNPTDLTSIITGQVSDRTPQVIRTTSASNLYIYLVGHGGNQGIPIAASSPAEGLKASGSTFSPKHLREALCVLQTEGRLRRALVVIESCYGGAFGDASYGGIELGCGASGAMTPLAGTVLLSAAHSREVSYAGAYDAEVGSWVNDAFSNQVVNLMSKSPVPTLSSLYTEVYLRIAGSHVSLYNAGAAGRLGSVPVDEFLKP